MLGTVLSVSSLWQLLLTILRHSLKGALSFENAFIPESVNHYPYASKLENPCLEFLSSRLVFPVTIEDLKMGCLAGISNSKNLTHYLLPKAILFSMFPISVSVSLPTQPSKLEIWDPSSKFLSLSFSYSELIELGDYSQPYWWLTCTFLALTFPLLAHPQAFLLQASEMLPEGLLWLLVLTLPTYGASQSARELKSLGGVLS